MVISRVLWLEEQKRRKIEGALAAICIFLISLTALSFEIVLTRLFSVVLHYHFSFLAISLSLCGLGFGGYIAHVIRRREIEDASRKLMVALTLYPVSIVLLPAALFRLLLPVGAAMSGIAAVAFIVAGCGLAAMSPFICVGFSLSVLFERHSDKSGALYAADLFGGALGCALAIWLLNLLGGINAALLICAGAALPGMLNSFCEVVRLHTSKAKRHISVSGLTLIASLLIFMLNLKMPSPPIDLPKLKQTHGVLIKPLWVELSDPRQRQRIIWTRWDAFGRTDVVQSELDKTLIHIYTDGHNPSLMLKFDGDLKKMREWERFIGFLPYKVRKPRRVLCLGSGGGLDVLLALIGGATEIDAVDVNTALPELMREFRGFNGAIYERDGVNLFISDGRSFVKQQLKSYDLIFSALTQTAASGGIGVALVESYIHTIEACGDYIGLLSNDGILAMIFQEPMLALRWWVTCVKALSQHLNLSESECATLTSVLSLKRKMMPTTPYRFIVLASKRRFDEDELMKLSNAAKEFNLEPLFIPGLVEADPFDLVRSGRMSTDDIIRRFSSTANVMPATDESPFFLDLSVGIPSTLWVLIAFAIFVLLLFMSCSLLFELRFISWEAQPISSILAVTAYFGALGMGYMLIEVALLQRLSMPLTIPAQALSVLLAALLIGSALGSALTQKVGDFMPIARCIASSSAMVAAISLLWFFTVGKCVDWLAEVGSMARMAILSIVLIVTGIPMGIPFPCGLRLLSLTSPRMIPYSWGVNGVMSVAGSVMTVMIGKLYGFSSAILTGALVYVIVAVSASIITRILQGRLSAQLNRSVEVKG